MFKKIRPEWFMDARNTISTLPFALFRGFSG